MLAKGLKRCLNVGQAVPGMKLIVINGNTGKFEVEQGVDAQAFFKDRKVALVGFPGAFTPTCQSTHLPEYIERAAAFKAKGVSIVGVGVNDFFIMKMFAEHLGGDIAYIADGSGTFTKALDAGVDLSEPGLGYRTRRFSALVDNGKITVVNDEGGPGMTELSAAETMLKALGN